MLGDKISQVVEVDTLATTPECQGRGYATTLVHLATDLVRAVPTVAGVQPNVVSLKFIGR